MEFPILSALAELGAAYARYYGRRLMRKLGGYEAAERRQVRRRAVTNKRAVAVKREADDKRAVAGIPTLEDIHEIISERWDVRYNALSNNLEARPAGRGNEAFEPVTERMHNSMVNCVQEVFPLCFRSKIDSYLFSDEVPSFNPLRGYLAGLPTWDGTDRIGELAARVSHDALWTRVFRTWLRGAAKGWMQEDGGDAFHKSFDAGGGQQEWLSANEIFEILKRESPKALQGVTIARLGKQLRQLGVTKRHTAQGNLYGVCRRE